MRPVQRSRARRSKRAAPTDNARHICGRRPATRPISGWLRSEAGYEIMRGTDDRALTVAVGDTDGTGAGRGSRTWSTSPAGLSIQTLTNSTSRIPGDAVGLEIIPSRTATMARRPPRSTPIRTTERPALANGASSTATATGCGSGRASRSGSRTPGLSRVLRPPELQRKLRDPGPEPPADAVRALASAGPVDTGIRRRADPDDPGHAVPARDHPPS